MPNVTVTVTYRASDGDNHSVWWNKGRNDLICPLWSTLKAICPNGNVVPCFILTTLTDFKLQSRLKVLIRALLVTFLDNYLNAFASFSCRWWVKRSCGRLLVLWRKPGTSDDTTSGDYPLWRLLGRPQKQTLHSVTGWSHFLLLFYDYFPRSHPQNSFSTSRSVWRDHPNLFEHLPTLTYLSRSFEQALHWFIFKAIDWSAALPI